MQRREVLAAIAGTAAGATATGVVGAARTDVERDAAPSSTRRGQTDGEGYQPLGRVSLSGARDLATDEDGRVAYVAVDDGIATVDVSTPSSPTVLAERRDLLADAENGPLRLLWDVWPDGDRLLAVAQANTIDVNDLHAALLFDVADPADPQLLDSYRTSYPIHNCFLADGVAYLTANGRRGNPLVLLDASDDELREVGSWSILDVDPAWEDASRALYQLHDVFVQGDTAYLAYWDAGTWLLDVADPSAPSALGHVEQHDPGALQSLDDVPAAFEAQTPPGNDHYVQVDEAGELLAVGREAWAAVVAEECRLGGAAGVDLYDVSDPTSIEHLGHVAPPASYLQTRDGPFTTAHNLDIVDDRLYCSWYFGGVSVHDVSDPSEPREFASWRDPDAAAFWTARSAVRGEYFVASSAADAGGFDDGIEGAVYVFPDEPGEQADPPSLTDAPADFEPLPRCEADGPAGDLVELEENVERPDAVDADGTDRDEEDDATPGFGLLPTLGGAGLAAGWLARRRCTADREQD